MKLWSVPDGRLAATLRGHTTEVYGVAVSLDGRLAATSDKDGGVVLWDLQKNERLRELVDPATPAIQLRPAPREERAREPVLP